MFNYKEPKIISAVPFAEILEYFRELGVCKENGSLYRYNGLEIEITEYKNTALPDLGMQRYLIDVQGDRTKAEEFLTAYRFRFLSAGG